MLIGWIIQLLLLLVVQSIINNKLLCSDVAKDPKFTQYSLSFSLTLCSPPIKISASSGFRLFSLKIIVLAHKHTHTHKGRRIKAIKAKFKPKNRLLKGQFLRLLAAEHILIAFSLSRFVVMNALWLFRSQEEL